MDPIQLIIQQYMAQAVPEWSVSKGQQPVDIGTLSQNMNYNQDIMQTLTDPFVGAMSGFIDESAFAPTYEEVELPDAPDTPVLAQWEASPNPVQQLILQGVSDNLDPRTVVNQLVEAGEITLPVDETTGKVDTSEFDYYVGEASKLRDELFSRNKWQSQVEQIQAQGPKEIPSETAKMFTEAGLRLPTERYSSAPEIGDSRAYADEEKKGYDSSSQAYRQALRARNNRRNESESTSEALASRQTSGMRASTHSRVPTQRGRSRSTGEANMVDPALRRRAALPAPHAGAMIGNANRAAQSDFQAKMLANNAMWLEKAGRTPFLDQIMGRAGL